MAGIRNKTKIYSRALKEVLESVAEEEIPEKIRNFKNLLKKRGELKTAGRIMREFKKIWSQKKGRAAEVITATPLTEEQRGKISRSLKEKGFIIKEKVDPAALGGIALIFGDENLIDRTIKNKIRLLWRNIKQ